MKRFIPKMVSLLAAAAMCVCIHFFTNNASTIKAAYILSISLVPFSLATVYQSISRGFEKLDHIETKYKELTDALASPEVMADSASCCGGGMMRWPY